MFYVYLHSPYGTELIGKSNDRVKAEKIKEEQDKKWEPGFLWDTEITEREQREVSYYN